MTGYRSIGEGELLYLIRSDNPVFGSRKWHNIEGSGCPDLPYGTVCFFQEPYRWHDKAHLFDIEAELPDSECHFGTAVYKAGKNMKKTKTFLGKAGSVSYEVPEIYIRSYSPCMIKKLYIGGHFAKHFVASTIVPFCEKYGIELIEELEVNV